MIADLVFMLSGLITSIVLFWVITNWMIRFRRIIVFFPFLLSVILLCFNSALLFYGVFDQKIWFILELCWAFIFLWVVMNLRRENGNN